jgi:hypothetical protein
MAAAQLGFPLKGKARKSKWGSSKLNNWYPGQRSLPSGLTKSPGTHSAPKQNNATTPKGKMMVDGRFGGGKKSKSGKAKGKKSAGY